jgi:hypothetical protein
MMKAQIRNDLSVGLNNVILATTQNEQLADALMRFRNGEELNSSEKPGNYCGAPASGATFRIWSNTVTIFAALMALSAIARPGFPP